ncbi:hypothetical protein C2S51_025939 [Perilla frutescens var. frutescens]|nr:hypothetical protein C2S51_025939 [Perilla frutescens var. frutescens]
MGGGFMFAANSTSLSAATPPFSATRSSPTPATCTGIQPCYGSVNDCIFGPVPSRAEVENAILELQRFMEGVSTTNKPEVEGFHGQLGFHQYPGFIKFSDAFAMMQAEPPLQSLVVSISCDKAVWESILSNKAVDDLRGSLAAAAAAGKEEKQVRCSTNECELAEIIWRWIIGFTKSKAIEMVEKFVSVVSEMFKHAPCRDDEPTSELHHLLDQKIRSSLLLSIIILLIVVVSRGHEYS